MVLKNKKLIISALLFAVVAAFTFAVEVPALTGRINDYADVLDSGTESELTGYLKRLEDQTGIQLAVLTVPTIEDESIEGFSMRVAEEWQLGQEGKDNGILITLALAERKIRIEVGYGLEGVLTDAQSGLILRNAIIPEFKDGDYSAGVTAGVSNIVGLILNDPELFDEDVLDEDSGSGTVAIIFVIIWVVFVLLIVFANAGKARRRGGSDNGAIAAAVILDTLSDIVGSSGSSSSGGSSFSGGGGGFGGGGASGGW